MEMSAQELVDKLHTAETRAEAEELYEALLQVYALDEEFEDVDDDMIDHVAYSYASTLYKYRTGDDFGSAIWQAEGRELEASESAYS